MAIFRHNGRRLLQQSKKHVCVGHEKYSKTYKQRLQSPESNS
jgi:hypothetical protein